MRDECRKVTTDSACLVWAKIAMDDAAQAAVVMSLANLPGVVWWFLFKKPILLPGLVKEVYDLH